MAEAVDAAKRVLAADAAVLYGIFGVISGTAYFPPREFLMGVRPVRSRRANGSILSGFSRVVFSALLSMARHCWGRRRQITSVCRRTSGRFPERR